MTAPESNAPAIARLTDFLAGRSGWPNLGERPDEVAAAARVRAGEAGCATLDEYILRLLSGELGSREVAHLLGALTIGETYFFRHPEAFAALEQAAFPEWAARGGTIRAWSAACSLGCEPYSLAISWDRFAGNPPSAGLEILATDLNHEYLERARAAHFGKWSLRNMPEEMVGGLFDKSGESFVLKPHHRRSVEFREFNLLDDPARLGLADGTLDLIMCRNVMIYFAPQTISSLARGFLRLLKPGGWLVTGASECNAELFSGFRAVSFHGAVLYRKEGQADLPAPAFRPWEPPVRIPDPGHPAQARPVPPVVPQRDEVVADLVGGRAEAAARRLAGLLRIDELNPEWHFLSGLADEALKRDAVAESAYRKCLFLDRGHCGALVALHDLLVRTGRGKAAEVFARTAAKYLAEVPSSSEILCTRGKVAAKTLLAALGTNPSSRE